jgi:hypothetical protein
MPAPPPHVPRALRRLLALTWLLLTCAPADAVGFESFDKLLTFENGSVNWTTGWITAGGTGLPGDPPTHDNLPAAVASGRNHARANLLAITRGLWVRSRQTAGELADLHPALAEKLLGMTAAAAVTRQDHHSDGSVTVTVAMSLFGGLSQLLLPPEIVPLETVKTVGSQKPPADTQPPIPQAYTGLVVDARGLKLQPALAPRIFSQNGNVVYDYAFVSREFAVQHGVCGYLLTPAAASRVGEHPMVVRALRTVGSGGCDLVVSNSDAARIRNAPEHLAFMRHCRVLIVVD